MSRIPLELIVTTLLPLTVLIPILLLGFNSINALIEILKSQHRELWEVSGRPSPIGFIFTGKIIRPQYIIACFIVLVQWTFKTPTWAQQNALALALLRRMRISLLIWNVGIILFFINLIRSLGLSSL